MGGVRAAVGVVLGVISLAVLSLHIALCIHYPSPLFAVTLLLNPSLWLFLGLIGMGCALLLTHRDQQRKVRAGHCVSCHTLYGSTVDTKWRNQDAKWQSGPQCQRGPSRAIYSYNGNLHKFYASYGTINEKQLIEMKHSTLKSPVSKSCETNGHIPSAKPTALLGSETNEKSPLTTLAESDNPQNSTGDKNIDEENNCSSLNNHEKNQAHNEEKLPCKNEEKLSSSNENSQSSQSDPKTATESISDKLNPNKEEPSSDTPLISKHSAVDTHTPAANVPPARLTPQEMLYRERRYCDCMARYGAIYQYPQLTRAPIPPRCHRYSSQDRTVGRYNRKLMMRCKLKAPGDVPVELFAAKETSCKDSDNSNPSSKNPITDDHGNSDHEKHGDHGNSDHETHDDVTEESLNCNNDCSCASLKSSRISEDASSTGCTDTTSLSSTTDNSLSKDSTTNQVPRTRISTNFIVPLKHMSRFFTQTYTSLPLGSPYNGKNKQTDNLEDFESTSISSDQTASEQDNPDQDVVSISSKSSLLPSSPEKSITSKDLTRSPLWRPFKSARIGRKRFSDEEKSSFEDNGKSQQSKGGEVSGHDSTNEDSQESPTATLKSVFTNKRSISKSLTGADKRKTSMFQLSNSNENVSSESTSPSVSPSMSEKRRQPSDNTSRFSKSKSSLNRKISSSKTQSLQKNSKTMLLSPAKAVRSLVFRNAQKRNLRARKLQEEKTPHSDSTPAKLPLLSSPNVEPSPSEPSSVATTTTTSTSIVSSSTSSTNNADCTTHAPATDVPCVFSSSKVSPSAAPVTCSTSFVSHFSSSSPSKVSSSCSPSLSSSRSTNAPTSTAWSSAKAGDSMAAPQQPSSGSPVVSSSNLSANDSSVKMPLISSPAISSTTSSTAASTTATMASSSSPCGSPSVRPKEPKKPRLRLKGKHRARPAESVMLLTADSDE